MKGDLTKVNHLMKDFSLIRRFWYTDEIGNPAVPIFGPCRFVRIDTMSRTFPAQGGPATLAFRIRIVMAERGIRSVAALQRMLKTIGVEISVPQLIRIVDGQSSHLSTVVLGGLITVLQCGIEDLIAVTEPGDATLASVPEPAY
jgi:hypothetical protein